VFPVTTVVLSGLKNSRKLGRAFELVPTVYQDFTSVAHPVFHGANSISSYFVLLVVRCKPKEVFAKYCVWNVGRRASNTQYVSQWAGRFTAVVRPILS
jgi:hypothetical protein